MLTPHQGDAVSLPAYQAPHLPAPAAPLPDVAAPPDALRHLALSGSKRPGEHTCQKPSRSSSRSAVLRLTCTAQESARAREFTQRTLGDWALEHCSDDALIVVAELAANAVVHALPHTRDGEARAWLRLSRRPNYLVCAVIDSIDRPPTYPRTSDPWDEHGRGLRIVDALSEHWGWTWRYRADGTAREGKTVWAMLPTGPRP